MSANTLTLTFSKMHGIGNDYIYFDTVSLRPDSPTALLFQDPAAIIKLAVRLSDRHKGIGSDGLIFIRPSIAADFMMDMYNADGSQGKMCGNAIRCVAKYAYDRGLTTRNILTIETLSGIRTLYLTIDQGQVSQVRVNMGKPELDPAGIPVLRPGHQVVQEPLTIDGRVWPITCVSMGNPHAVTFTDQVEQLDLAAIGPLFENHAWFPDRINTEFVQILDRQNVRMRVWERGSGETMACGTGACACAVASALTGQTDRQVTVHLNGGDLFIEWPEDTGEVFMTGSATFVFEGTVLWEVE